MPLTNEKIEAIRKACIAVNPDIVRPQLGSVVKKLTRDEEGIVLDVTKFPGESDCLTVFWKKGYVVMEPETFHQIIGRPIRLADVLLLVEKASSDRASEGMTADSFAECSHQAEVTREAWWGCVLDHWNLRKDDLNEQDEATINFIYDLIK